MKAIFYIFFIISPFLTIAQGSTDQQLAEHYYANNDYEKALIYYEKLFDENPNKHRFNRYFECLLATDDKRTAEKLLKKEVRKNTEDLDYAILLGQFYEDNGEPNKADDIYHELVEELSPSSSKVIALYNAFKEKGKSDLSYQTLVKGRKLLKNYPLHFQFAEYYGSKGEHDKMIAEYLQLLDYNSGYLSSLKRVLSRQIDFSEKEKSPYTNLKKALLKRAQKNPGDRTSSDLLIWFFTQSKEFNAALVQLKAMDKRNKEEGRNVYNFGIVCAKNKSYATARKAFEYVKNLGKENFLYYRAESALLNTRYREIISDNNYSPEEINTTIQEYEVALNRLGENRKTIPLILELSHIQAYYGRNASSAISRLTKALEIEHLTDMQRAEIKMKLADIEVLHGDIWEASLLYMQVDKNFQYEEIGHEARFKNARIFYYDGEFNYAQSQLDVLKQSTSKLISNNAIELSLLITDNFGLDSNFQAMWWFAQADLLIEQHQYSKAFQLFDSITTEFPFHSLGDEVLLKKSKAMQYQGKWSEAINYLDKLIEFYPEDILADNAWFIKGKIYEEHLLNIEKAKECYKTVLLQFKGSLYVTEARKRFRKLRGENVEEDFVEREEVF